MARSEDAIRRRALKRQRTEEEQRQVDGKAIEQAKNKKRKQQQHHQQQQSQDDSNNGQQESQNQLENPMDEIGAWKCPGCGNENFASRNWCNSKTCNEQRPSHVPQPRSLSRDRKFSSTLDKERGMKENTWICTSCQYDNFLFRETCNGPSCQQPRPSDIIVTTKERKPPKQQRHDPETSKPLVWSKQADPATLSKNHKLRQRYMETKGEGMSEEEKERAKVLIERDERKRLKKLQKNTTKATEESKDDKAITTTSTSQSDKLPAKTTAILDSKAQMSKNKRLRELFLATGGKNMTPDDIERAKLLLARDERKRNNAATNTRATTKVATPQHVGQ